MVKVKRDENGEIMEPKFREITILQDIGPFKAGSKVYVGAKDEFFTYYEKGKHKGVSLEDADKIKKGRLLYE